MPRIQKKGTASSGRKVTKKARSRKDQPVRLTNKPPFVYIAHPLRWTVLEGEVVPLLKELRFIDDPNVDPDDERAKWRKRGWTEIPWDVRGPDTNYLRAHDAINRTTAYLSEFETPHKGSSVVVSDVAGFVEFCCWLKDHAKIDAPEPYVLEELRDRARKRFEDYAGKAHSNPKLQGLADRARADMDTLSAELDAVLGIEPPKKKKKKKKEADSEPQD